VELALTYWPGEGIITPSVNQWRMARRSSSGSAPWRRSMERALVVGSIDEDTSSRRRAFTRPSARLAVGAAHPTNCSPRKYGIRAPEDIIIDPLVFSVPRPGDANYIGGGGWKPSKASGWLKGKPCRTPRQWLGISNISFRAGPQRAREVVNFGLPVLLARRPGLGFWAIVNAEKLGALRLRFQSTSGGWRRICSSIFKLAAGDRRGRKRCARRPRNWARGPDGAEQKAAINQFHIAAVAETLPGKAGGAGPSKRGRRICPLDPPHWANYIIEGNQGTG